MLILYAVSLEPIIAMKPNIIPVSINCLVLFTITKNKHKRVNRCVINGQCLI